MILFIFVFQTVKFLKINLVNENSYCKNIKHPEVKKSRVVTQSCNPSTQKAEPRGLP